MRARWMTVVAAVALVVGGCADQDGGTDTSTGPSPEPSQSADVNGSVLIATSSVTQRYPIKADGSLGAPISVTGLGSVLDGRGGSLLTGQFVDDPYSTRVDVQDATTGEATATQQADWCGGEGPEHKACVLLDDTRIARTPVLWASGDGGPVTISSMVDGTTQAELGPFAALLDVLGTESSQQVLLLITDPAQGGDLAPYPPAGLVQRLDLTTGATTDIGRYPAQFWPLCAVGSDSLLGYVAAADGSVSLEMIGPAVVHESLLGAGVTWGAPNPPLGCSADGRFVYAQVASADGESLSLERIALADGSRTPQPEPSWPSDSDQAPVTIVR
jgi:hypothetical protein